MHKILLSVFVSRCRRLSRERRALDWLACQEHQRFFLLMQGEAVLGLRVFEGEELDAVVRGLESEEEGKGVGHARESLEEHELF